MNTRLVAFDPNAATLEELLQLGFTESIARRIINYRNKDGRFQVKRDMLKIYGVDSTTFGRLHPYIALPEVLPRETRTYPTQESLTSSFDLNACDSAQLVSVRGIGPVLAARIVKFRLRLGGFVSSEQLYEVYGLDSVTVLQMKDQTFVEPQFVPARLNINTATESELNTHPYLNRNLARTIVAYRKQHGPFLSVDDIKGIKLMDELTFNKLRPYLDASLEDNQQNRE
jgi:competence ComEA-like helix-hairpin-helix protein